MIGLVAMKNNNVFTNTQLISDGLGMQHETVVRLLRKSQDLAQLSDLESEAIKTKGRRAQVYWLNEEQATLLICLMRNSGVVREFKSKLVGEFFRQRRIIQKLLTQKENAQWLAKRSEGKVARLQATDAIKEFVNYATDQGSKSAHMYYVNISKMENKALFMVAQKFPNIRDVMSARQLIVIETADMAVEDTLRSGMEEGLQYKDIYIKAKEKVLAIAKIFPPSPLPGLLQKQIGTAK